MPASNIDGLCSTQSCIKYSTNKYQYQYQWSKYKYKYQYLTFKYQYQYKYCALIIGTQLHCSCTK